jgi:hypothetical protein
MPKERPTMSIERVYSCDWRECECHVRSAGTRPPIFLTVTEGSGQSLHFCTWDCLLRHAAEKPPAEVGPVAELG